MELFHQAPEAAIRRETWPAQLALLSPIILATAFVLFANWRELRFHTAGATSLAISICGAAVLGALLRTAPSRLLRPIEQRLGRPTNDPILALAALALLCVASIAITALLEPLREMLSRRFLIADKLVPLVFPAISLSLLVAISAFAIHSGLILLRITHSSVVQRRTLTNSPLLYAACVAIAANPLAAIWSQPETHFAETSIADEVLRSSDLSTASLTIDSTTDLPLIDLTPADFDVVYVRFHTDAEARFMERVLLRCKRALKPGGRILIAWNDVSARRIARLSRLMKDLAAAPAILRLDSGDTTERWLAWGRDIPGFVRRFDGPRVRFSLERSADRPG